MKIYFAGPLFTQNERIWNRDLAARISGLDNSIEVFLPQKVTIESKFNDPKMYTRLFKILVEAIDASDAVVAILDGADSDSGTSWEVGYAYGKGKRVIGVRTDFRKNDDKGLNVMLRRSLDAYVFHMSFSESLDLVAKAIVRKLRKA
jgi:nucleoside 2-deoxyribosyltransferase